MEQLTGLKAILHWLKLTTTDGKQRHTIEFIGLRKKMHNLDFNVTEFRNIKNESGSSGFILSTKNGSIQPKPPNKRKIWNN